MLKRIVRANVFVLFTVLTFVFVTGCTKPPTEEIASAEKAVAEAKQKEADLYVEEVFAKAEEALHKAKKYVEERKYKEAKPAAEEATALAQQSITMIEPNKEKMKAEALQIITEVQNSLGELKSSVVLAIKKKTQIDREKIQGDIGKWEIDLVSIQEQIQSEKIRQSYDQIVSIRDSVSSQKENLAATMEQQPEKK